MTNLLRIMAVFAFYAVSLNAADGWLTDLDVALAKGRKESKPLFVFFNDTATEQGRQLEAKIFASAEFKRASSRYVLLRIDCDMSDAANVMKRTKNSQIGARYDIPGHPCVVVVDAQSGDSFGMLTGGQTLSPRDYIGKIMAFKNTQTGRAKSELEQKKTSKVMSVHEDLVGKISAAVAVKDLRSAERLLDELYKDSVPKNNPGYWLNRAEIVLEVDPGAKAQAARYFDLAAKNARDDAHRQEIAKKRAAAGL
jgi:hypothetical protein